MADAAYDTTVRIGASPGPQVAGVVGAPGSALDEGLERGEIAGDGACV